AIARWSPDLLICTDDLAVRQLHILHQRTAASDDKARRYISELIELSLGPAISCPTMHNKSELLARVQNGLRCPKTIVIPATRPFDLVPADLTYPIVAKADQSYGGLCVRTVNGASDVRSIVWELQMPPAWPSILRRFFGTILGSEALASFRLPLRRTISLQ